MSAWAKTTKKLQLYFQEMKDRLTYRYFFSMSDEESHSESESNELLRAQANVGNYFRCFYCILFFKHNAKKVI